MSRILLTSTMSQPFVHADAEILRRRHDVDVVIGSGPLHAARIFAKAREADLTLCWFASVYALPAVMGAKVGGGKSVIVVGGVDAAALPEIGYGLWSDPRRAEIIRRALKMADRILPVDERLLLNLRRLSGLDLPRAEILPTGYDAARWTPPSDHIERTGVLSVAICETRGRALVKGVDLLVEAARMLPAIPFTLIGLDRAQATMWGWDPPANMRLLPRIAQPTLLDAYRSARIYCQPSRHEGLPNALCEAMLCGAVPVGADVGGVASAIGESGVVVVPGDADALRAGIRRALAMPVSIGDDARERIARRYPTERRAARLLAIVDELLAEGR